MSSDATQKDAAQTDARRAAQLFGYDVIDSAGSNVGSVDSVWVDDATDELEFIGVKTGWLLGKTHVIPTADAKIGDNSIRVPYPEAQIKDAPSFHGDQQLSPEDEDGIYSYYGVRPPASDAGGDVEASDAGEMTTSDVSAGEQQVDTGRVRLRKVANAERTEEPVETQPEQVSVEQAGAGDTDASSARQEGETEEPVTDQE